MPANNLPLYGLTPVIGLGQVTVANANRDGTGTLVSILTGGTNGTRIDRIRIKAIVSTTAGMIRLFIYDGTSVTRLITEIPVDIVTVAATVEAFEEVSQYSEHDAIKLPANYVLKASTEKAEAINIIAEGWNY